MRNKNMIFAGCILCACLFGIVILISTDAYIDFLFSMACGGNNKEILSVNTHNIENVDFWYKQLYKKGKKINGFLKGKKYSNEYTSYIFRGRRLKKREVALFMYSDINGNCEGF